MLHVSDSVFQSLFSTLKAEGNFPLSKYLHDSIFSMDFHYGDDWVCKLDKTVCKAKDAGTPIEFTMKLGDDTVFELSKDNIKFNSSLEFTMSDEEGLLTEFTLNHTSLDMNITSDPLYARVGGSVNTWRFYGAEVNQQGSIWVDPREVRKDDSDSFNSMKD
jgi:hypothetical protein